MFTHLQAITAQPLTDARARLARLEWRASIGIPVPSAEITEASAHLQGLLAPPAKKEKPTEVTLTLPIRQKQDADAM